MLLMIRRVRGAPDLIALSFEGAGDGTDTVRQSAAELCEFRNGEADTIA